MKGALPRRTISALPWLLLLSGASALVIEVTWARWFRLLFGATAPAASAAVVAFLLGNALGAAMAARQMSRLQRPLRAYAVTELCVVAGACAAPWLLELASGAIASHYDALLDNERMLTPLRFGAALLATLPASMALGASWPLAVAASHRAQPAQGGRSATRLYAVNTAGGALGAGLAAFWLPAAFGVSGAYTLALAGSGLAGLAAFWLARAEPRALDPKDTPGEPAPRAAETTPAPSITRSLSGRYTLSALAALSGFGSFALQLLLVQAYAQVLDQSAFAFGAVLVVLLAALGLGAACVSVGVGRIDPGEGLAWALALTTIAAASFPALLGAVTGGFAYLGAEDSYLLACLRVVALTGGPLFLCAGLVFPQVLASASADADRGTPARLGRLLAINTLGAIAGALAAPFFLIPWLGVWPAIGAVAVLYAIPAAWATPKYVGSGVAIRLGLLTIGWITVLRLVSPFDIPLVQVAEGERVLFLETSAAGSVAVIERSGDGTSGKRSERLIRNDDHYALGGTSERIHERRQGHLPLLLHGDPKRVAFVGSATAITAGAAVAHPVASITLVELVPAVSRAAQAFFGDANAHVYRDPRTHAVVDDARNFLAHTAERFDVVVADLFVPWRAGTGALYSAEHFAAVRARLEPGGLFCQWLPLYQLEAPELEIVIATFQDVFPEAVVFRGDFYGAFPIIALVGWRDAAPALAAIDRAAKRLGVGEEDRWVSSSEALFSLYVGPLAPLRARLATVPRNRDDRPEIELRSARAHRGATGLDAPVVGDRWQRFSRELIAARIGGAAPFGVLPPTLARAATGGDALQEASIHYASGRQAEARRSFERGASLLPPELVRTARPDESALEVWIP